jgi:hypothetical protein
VIFEPKEIIGDDDVSPLMAIIPNDADLHIKEINEEDLSFT